jgi:hypothetical protein
VKKCNFGEAAIDFRQALEKEFRGSFSDIVFAVKDWSVEKKFLGPFRDTFLPSAIKFDPTSLST